MIQNNEAAAICGPCGGRCCQTMPGATFPADWGSTPEEMTTRLREELTSGRFQVDWWEGDPRPDTTPTMEQALYVRPTVAGLDGKVYAASWGGVCSLLGVKGCALAWEKRPTECRALKPVADGKGCRGDSNFDKQAACIAWIPYESLLRQVADEVNNAQNPPLPRQNVRHGDSVDPFRRFL